MLSRGSSGAKRRGRWRWRAASVVVWAATSVALASGQAATSGEYQSKANFISQFPNFVEWPDTAFATAQVPFAVCVYGNFSFGTALALATQRETFHNRKMDVRWVRKIAEVRACQILFVSRSESGRYAQVLEAVRNEEVLTVGETPEFLGAGGAISFSYDKQTLQFEVNLGATKDARLTMSSRLLALARRVVNRPEAAKG